MSADAGGKMRVTAKLIAVSSLLVLPVAVACGLASAPTAEHAHAAVAATAGNGWSVAEIAATPGTSPRPGSPAFCVMLARSSALSALPAALTAASQRSRQSQAAPTLRSAAADLVKTRRAAPASLWSGFGSAASALARLAGQNGWSIATLDAVSASLTRLGQEVEGPCGFPVG